jgi:hypothetical protein
MMPTLYAQLALDGLAHKVGRGDLHLDEALARAYTIGAKDLELQQRIDTARARAKELVDASERTDQGTRDPDPQSATPLG